MICTSCGSQVEAVARPGRVFSYVKGVDLKIPDDMEIAECVCCGEMFHTESDAVKLGRIGDSVARSLLKHCAGFIDEHDIGCSETIYQCDRVILNAHEFIEGVCEIVGYKDRSEEESEDE